MGGRRLKSTGTNEKPTLYETFVAISLIGTASFVLYALLAGARAFDWIVMCNESNWQFADYFGHLMLAQNMRRVYSWAVADWGVFPPLAYLFYRALHMLTARDGNFVETPTDYQSQDYVLLAFMFYVIFLTLALLYAVKSWNRNRYKAMFLCLLTSVPFFAGAYERGNSCLAVVVLLLIAMKWKDDESKVKRELALFMIAVCAGLKIYPAIFGLPYLKERRWKEAFRLTLYGVVLFFAPFVFFEDGAFSRWFRNMTTTFGMVGEGRFQFVKGLVNSFFSNATGKTTNGTPGAIAAFAFLILMILLAFLAKSEAKTAFFLCAAMTFFPTNAFRYTLCYLSIPLVIELSERGSERIGRNFQSVEIAIYGLLFTIPTYWGAFTTFRLNKFDEAVRTTYVEAWVYAIAYLLVAAVTFHEISNKAKKRRSTRLAKSPKGVANGKRT